MWKEVEYYILNHMLGLLVQLLLMLGLLVQLLLMPGLLVQLFLVLGLFVRLLIVSARPLGPAQPETWWPSQGST